ncbi:MAG: NUDIX domain-containing protein [Thermodesulfobacteriota bacterium]
MGTGQEMVVVVDAGDREIGRATRAEMRRQRLIHRAAYVLVFNRHGELFVQQRTMTKDVYPGHYDVAAGGVVLAGESYEEAAARELAEELGIAPALRRLFDNFHEDRRNRVWGRVFTCVADGPFTLQEEEVAAGFFLPLAEVLALSRTAPFTPDGLVILERFLAGRTESGRGGHRPPCCEAVDKARTGK